jgi:zinc transporter
MEPIVEELEDNIAAVEERMVLGEDTDFGESLFPLRKRLTIFRRYVTPQKLVLQKLHEERITCLCSENQQHFGEELDRVTRYIEELDELASRMQILNEELRNAHAERLNDLTYVFSVVATVFLPLGFLTGLLGINVGGVPAANHPYGFWLFTALCITVSGILLIAFKKFKWF